MNAVVPGIVAKARFGQCGAVLLLSLVFLLLLGLVASTMTRTSTLQFQMAGNEQFREQAFQKAQAVVSAVAASENHFPVAGKVGDVQCARADSCDAPVLQPSAAVGTVAPGVKLNYRVVRKGPLLLEHLPFRVLERRASSTQHFDVAVFEVSADVDGSAVRQGKASVAEGIARRFSSSSWQRKVGPK